MPSKSEPVRLLELCKDESGLLVNSHGIGLNPFQYKMFQLQNDILKFWNEHAEAYVEASRFSSSYSVVVDGLDPDRGLFTYFDPLVVADPILGVRHAEPWKLAYGIALGLQGLLSADDLLNAADDHPLIACIHGV